MMPPQFSKKKFADEVVENFEHMKPESYIPEDDYTLKMLRGSRGDVKMLLSAIVVVCPHSMTVERVVSSYNILIRKP